MSATRKAFELLKKSHTPEAEVLRDLFGRDHGQAVSVELLEDLAAQYIVALAVSKGYDKQLDADLAAALDDARKQQS